jgi:hypothetical protein
VCPERRQSMYRRKILASLLCLASIATMTVFAQTTKTLDKNGIGLVIGATETPRIGEGNSTALRTELVHSTLA